MATVDASGLTSANLLKALTDLENLKAVSLQDLITNPGDFANDLGVLKQALAVVAIFVPQAAVLEDIVAALILLLPLVEAGIKAGHFQLPTPDPDPVHDAQTTMARGGRTY